MSAVYREYQPGWCNNPKCQKDMGLAQQYGGRDRKYCSTNCRVQAGRVRKQKAAAFKKAQEIRVLLKIEAYDLGDETLRLVAELGEFGPAAIEQGVILAHAILTQQRIKLEKRGIFS